jgi:glutathione S-transferase
MLGKLDRRLHGRQFLLGDRLTMPDLVGVVSIDFGQRTRMEALADLSAWPSVRAWHAEVSERPAFADH